METTVLNEHATSRQAGLSDEAMRAKTGKSWREWATELDGVGASKLTKSQLEHLVLKRWPGLGRWWAQVVVAGYARQQGSGLHAIGGRFEVSRSKAYPVTVRELFEAFHDPAQRGRWLGDAPKLRSAIRDRSIRFAWGDGTPVHVTFSTRGSRATVTVQEKRLRDANAAMKAKAAWDTRLRDLRQHLASR